MHVSPSLELLCAADEPGDRSGVIGIAQDIVSAIQQGAALQLIAPTEMARDKQHDRRAIPLPPRRGTAIAGSDRVCHRLAGLPVSGSTVIELVKRFATNDIVKLLTGPL